MRSGAVLRSPVHRLAGLCFWLCTLYLRKARAKAAKLKGWVVEHNAEVSSCHIVVHTSLFPAGILSLFFFWGLLAKDLISSKQSSSLIFSPKFSPGSHQLNLSSYVIASVFIVSCYKYKTNVNTVKSNIQLYSVYFAPYHFLVVTVSIYRGWLQTPLWCPFAVPLLASSKISLQDHTIFQFEYCYQKENQNMLLRICQFPQMTMSALLLPPFIRLNYKCKHSS